MARNIKTENDLIKATVPIILGMNDGRSKIIAIPEVPRSWGSHNDCMDLLLMSLRTKEMMAIEFKLNNSKKLESQIYNNRRKTGIKTIGIIPKNAKSPEIFSIENDAQIERLCDYLFDYYDINWTKPYPGNNGLVYWYAYKDVKEFNYDNAGLGRGGEKQEFATIYKIAMENIIKEIEQKGMSPLIMQHCLRGYSESSVRKFMREIRNE